MLLLLISLLLLLFFLFCSENNRARGSVADVSGYFKRGDVRGVGRVGSGGVRSYVHVN